MNKTILACALLCACMSAAAKDQVVKLSTADATALNGKTVALTVHDRPTFIAMTAGKATFAILGVGAMAVAGNKLVVDNHVADPARIIQTNLANMLRDVDGAQLLAPDATPTKAEKPAEIAATHRKADYVLDVRSGGWNYAYYPNQWGHYWIGYSVQIQLVDAKSGRQVANAVCNTNTQANHNPPTREQIEGNGAQLLKDVTTGLGWTCVQLLATQLFNIPADKTVATPAEFVDPLVSLGKPGTPDSKTAGASPAGSAPQSVPKPDASGDVAPSPAPAPPAPPAMTPPATGTEASH